MKLTHTFAALTLSASLAATAAFAASHAAKAPPAVEARHAQMQMVGYQTGVLGSIAKGEMPYDAAMVDSAAKNLQPLLGWSTQPSGSREQNKGPLRGHAPKQKSGAIPQDSKPNLATCKQQQWPLSEPLMQRQLVLAWAHWAARAKGATKRTAGQRARPCINSAQHWLSAPLLAQAHSGF